MSTVRLDFVLEADCGVETRARGQCLLLSLSLSAAPLCVRSHTRGRSQCRLAGEYTTRVDLAAA